MHLDYITADVITRILRMLHSDVPISVISQKESVSISYIKKLKRYYKKYLEYKALCSLHEDLLTSLCGIYPELNQVLSNNDVLINTTPSLFRKYYKTINDFIFYNKIYDFSYWTDMVSAFHYAVFMERKAISRQVIMNNFISAGYHFPLNSLAGNPYKFSLDIVDKAYQRYKVNLYAEKNLIVAYSNNNKMYFMFTDTDDIQNATDMFIQKLANSIKIANNCESIILFITTNSGHFKYRSKAVGYTFDKLKEQGLIPPDSDSIIPV